VGRNIGFADFYAGGRIQHRHCLAESIRIFQQNPACRVGDFGIGRLVGNLLIGKLVDTSGFDSAWLVIGIAGIFLILCAAAMCITDKKYFPLLYEKSTPGGTPEAFSDSEPESSASGSDK